MNVQGRRVYYVMLYCHFLSVSCGQCCMQIFGTSAILAIRSDIEFCNVWIHYHGSRVIVEDLYTTTVIDVITIAAPTTVGNFLRN